MGRDARFCMGVSTNLQQAAHDVGVQAASGQVERCQLFHRRSTRVATCSMQELYALQRTYISNGRAYRRKMAVSTCRTVKFGSPLPLEFITLQTDSPDAAARCMGV